MKLEFRALRADEIDCRINQCNQYGVSLLLYKDARCDQNILDEKVGPMNWQRHHSRDNANCIVSIWDDEKKQWIEKEDTGTESYTEKEKGLASDSFKRACFNWGIGRELYTAPNMFVFKKDLKTLEESNGRWTCKDAFRVTDIDHDDKGNIIFVQIVNLRTNGYIEFGQPAEADKLQKDIGKQTIDAAKVEALAKKCEADGVSISELCNLYKVNSLCELTEKKHANILAHWDKVREI